MCLMGTWVVRAVDVGVKGLLVVTVGVGVRVWSGRGSQCWYKVSVGGQGSQCWCMGSMWSG